MIKYKGIILAGGSGSRLNPVTSYITKHLLPVYDKPMIFYPLSVLMLAKIREILIISSAKDIDFFKKLLGDGSDFGLKIDYAIQNKPEGIAQAFLIGEKFIGKDNVSLILGDNIFFGSDFSKSLIKASKKKIGSTLFTCNVKDPERYGVITLDKKNNPKFIVEKPTKPISNLAVTGLYFYDNSVIKVAKKLKPSLRGELEITDLNNNFIKKKTTNVEILDRGFYWNDAGTYSSLLETSMVIKNFQSKNNSLIAVPEEISLNNKWINKKKMKKNLNKYANTKIYDYLKKLINSS